MAQIARGRGLTVYESTAESLPFEDAAFDFVTMITTLCFLDDPQRALREVWRVLKPGGAIIIGMVDEESDIGKGYIAKRRGEGFYRYAHFYSVPEVVTWLGQSGFDMPGICQTLFRDIDSCDGIEPVRDGYGEGMFAVIAARKY
jgi:ubiquinone/menaquinone biosynthesis C-methylase UbiE